MQKFHEYNKYKHKINEGAFAEVSAEEKEKIEDESIGIFNWTPIFVIGGIGLGGYVTIKIGRKILETIHGGLGGWLGVGKTIAKLQAEGAFANDVTAFTNKVNGTYKAMKSVLITREGMQTAKDLSTLFKSFGVNSTLARNAAIKAVLTANGVQKTAMKNIRLLQAEGKISEFAVESFEDFITHPDKTKTEQVAKLMNKGNAAHYTHGGFFKRQALRISRVSSRIGVPTKILQSAAWKATARLLARLQLVQHLKYSMLSVGYGQQLKLHYGLQVIQISMNLKKVGTMGTTERRKFQILKRFMKSSVLVL